MDYTKKKATEMNEIVNQGEKNYSGIPSHLNARE
jgi:hypothetical protein